MIMFLCPWDIFKLHTTKNMLDAQQILKETIQVPSKKCIIRYARIPEQTYTVEWNQLWIIMDLLCVNLFCVNLFYFF